MIELNEIKSGADIVWHIISNPFVAALLAIPIGVFLFTLLFARLFCSKFGPWIVVLLIAFFIFLVTR